MDDNGYTLIFAAHKKGLPDSIMVVRQFLVLFVEVRILVGQQTKKSMKFMLFFVNLYYSVITIQFLFQPYFLNK